MEALFEVVGSVMVEDVCDCTKAGVVPEPEGIPEIAVKLTVVVSGIHQTQVCICICTIHLETQSHFVVLAQISAQK